MAICHAEVENECVLTAEALVNKDEVFLEGGPSALQNSSKDSVGSVWQFLWSRPLSHSF